LDLIYHDLNMVVLRNQNPNKKTYRAIASIVANVLIYNHNPEPGRPLRRSKVEQEYISNKFIIGNWISTGLKALVLTTAPTAANALQIESSSDENSPSNENKKPNLLNRLLGRKKIK